MSVQRLPDGWMSERGIEGAAETRWRSGPFPLGTHRSAGPGSISNLIKTAEFFLKVVRGVKHGIASFSAGP